MIKVTIQNNPDIVRVERDGKIHMGNWDEDFQVSNVQGDENLLRDVLCAWEGQEETWEISPEKLEQEVWCTKMRDRVMEAQANEIVRKYGDEVANHANYGWGDATRANRVDIATKILEVGKVLSSTADFPSEEIQHVWRDY